MIYFRMCLIFSVIQNECSFRKSTVFLKCGSPQLSLGVLYVSLLGVLDDV